MSATEPIHKREHRRREANRLRSTVLHFCRGWWIEILVAILIGLGVFLLVERINIRVTLLNWGAGLSHGLQAILSTLVNSLAERLRQTTVSDLVAYALFAIVICLVVWRVRHRLTTSPRLTSLSCPRCGASLHRVHRLWHDHVINLFVPVRRYRCASHDCRWRGLRFGRLGQK